MKRLIDQLTASVAKPLLKKYQDSDDGRASFAAFRQKLAAIPDSGWKRRYQWGDNDPQSTVTTPLKRLEELLADLNESAPDAKSPSDWTTEFLEELVPLARDAAGCDPYQNPREYVLYGAELAICLGTSVAGWKSAAEFLKQGKRILSESLDLFLDEKGMPSVEVLPYFRLLMASWTRLRYLETARNLKLFSEDEKLLYEWAARCLILLTNADGTQRGAADAQLEFPEAEIEFFKAVLELDSDQDDQNQALVALPWISKAKAQAAKDIIMTEPCTYSEWSRVAVMQNGWNCNAPSVLMTYRGPDMNLSIAAGGRRLVEGPWKTAVSVGGKKIQPTGDWEQVCYACQDYYAYLEMEQPLESGISLGRTIALLHEDELLVLADSIRFPESRVSESFLVGITGVQPGQEQTKRLSSQRRTSRKKIVSQATWKFCSGVSFENAYDSAEGWIQAGKAQRTVFPLALPEWKTAASVGSLSVNRNQELVYQTHGQGVSLFSPLVIDLNPRRAHNAFTWRHLTVTQKGADLPPDIARAFRLMIGDDQWLFYQSQCPPAPRAVWGHHLINQTYWGRFIDGEFEPIVEIE